jgi:predicted enzyme related to lactoylglutathione lyase
MPTFGNFCWLEVNLEDPERGKRFYSELFGWRSEDIEGPKGQYTMMKIGDDLAAGLLKMPENAKRLNAPPHWIAYVAVSDVAEATRKAKSLGAQVLLEPIDVGSGNLSVIADPTGAVLAFWKSVKPLGTFLWGEANTMCWAELTTTDPVTATRFYVEMFGWRPEVVSMGDIDYTLLHNDDRMIAGLMRQPPPMVEAKAPSFWTVYFEVADCDATAKRAKQLGGDVVMPPTDIPGAARFAILKDPEGAAFAVIKNAPKN